MPEKEQRLRIQHELEPSALKGINRLIVANRQNGQIEGVREVELVEGLRALANLPHSDFKTIFELIGEEQSGKKRTKRLA